MGTKILGLDISTSCIGWSLLEINNRRVKFIECGFIHPSKKGSLLERLSSIKTDIKELLIKTKPDQVAIEDNAEYMPGKTTAHTIILLAIVNKTIGLTIFEETGKEPEFFSVLTIRHGLKRTNKMPAKEEMPALVEQYLKIKIPQRIKKTGTISPEYYDQADGIAVGLYCAYLKTDQLKTIAKLRKDDTKRNSRSL